MERLLITQRVTFDAAHQLAVDAPVIAKCKQLHGHRYVLLVTVSGPVFEVAGMVTDFANLKGYIQQVVGPLDHCFLNEIVDHPTGENLVLHIRDGLRVVLPPQLSLTRVVLQETENCSVEWEA
jgi:6-pyruvoyltetrahydropterin/6-carboxytetrahydropterin synthase